MTDLTPCRPKRPLMAFRWTAGCDDGYKYARGPYGEYLADERPVYEVLLRDGSYYRLYSDEAYILVLDRCVMYATSQFGDEFCGREDDPVYEVLGAFTEDDYRRLFEEV